MESVQSHGVSRVILASEDLVVVDVMLRLKAWPSFKLQSLLLCSVLANLGN